MGLKTGATRVQSLSPTGSLENLNTFWSKSMHDNQYGSVTDISISFDERFLLSVGYDGNFFVQSFMEESKIEEVIGAMQARISAKVFVIR